MKWSIGKKLAISFALLCFVTGIMAILVINESVHVRENAEELKAILGVRARLSRGRIEHLNWIVALDDYLITGKEFNGELHPTKCKFGKWLYNFDPEKLKDLTRLLKEIEKPHHELHEAATQIISLCNQGKIDRARNLYTEISLPAIAKIQSHISHMRHEILNPLIEELERELAQSQARQMVVTFVTFATAILLAILIWVVLVRKIVAPITGLTSDVSQMTRKEDFSRFVEVKSKDEFGILGESFNAMTNKINLLISELEENAMTLALDLSEQFEVLQKMNKGDFSLPAPENSSNELVAKLGRLINNVLDKFRTSSREAEENAMTLALDLSEQFEVLQKMNKGDFSLPAPENSSNELVAKLGGLINQILNRFRETTMSLTNIMESAPVGIFSLDMAGTITSTNPAHVRMCGPEATAEEILSQSIYTLEDRSLVPYFEKATLTQKPIEDELQCQTTNEANMWISVKFAPVFDATGKMTGTIGMVDDITEKRHAEKALLDMAHQSGMAEMAAGVLHNIGNAINSVGVRLGSVYEVVSDLKIDTLKNIQEELLRHSGDLDRYLKEDEKGRLLLPFMDKLTKRLEDTRESILDDIGFLKKKSAHIAEIIALQQSYPGMQKELKTKADANQILKDALEMHKESIEKWGIRVDKEFVPLFEADLSRNRLIQVFVNLIKNAIEAIDMNPDGDKWIRLSTALEVRDKKSFFRVEVADSGIGVEKEDLEQIFHYGFSRKKGGHGFGLHTSTNYIKMIGGDFEVKSEGRGKGASFSVLIPTGKDELALSSFDLGKLITGISRRFSKQIKDKRLSVHFKAGEELENVLADKEKVDQMADYILKQATERSLPGSSITFSTQCEDGYWVVSCTGSGLFPEDGKTDFKSAKEDRGLLLCRHFAQIHKGNWNEKGLGFSISCDLNRRISP